MDENSGPSSASQSRKPALKFILLLLTVFTLYTAWHILIGRNLVAVLPRIPGRLPKNDPVYSLYDAFQASFMMGFISVFVVAMLINSVAMLSVKFISRGNLRFICIYILSGLAGFLVDATIILILEKGHGAWNYWPDIRSEWQAVATTTALISLSGGMAAALISWRFFSVAGRDAESWRKRFLIGTVWWVMLIVIAWTFSFSGRIESALSHQPWWTTLAIIGSFFLLQSVPLFLIMNAMFQEKRANNTLLALAMPFLATFGFLAILITYAGMNYCCIE